LHAAANKPERVPSFALFNHNYRGTAVKNILRSAVLSAITALSAQSAMADVTVSGDYLKFGVGNNGSLIDFTITGLQFDPTGSGNFAGAPDFLTPGSPFAFYSVGVNGMYDTARWLQRVRFDR
jgi:hypothetical protein